MAEDPYRMQRFVEAQEQGQAFERALAELRAGRKKSHWMWFIFPQADGLGSSSMARTYAIRSLVEARAYATHPILGTRLLECSRALIGLTGKTAREIFGDIDATKLRSSMTLFCHACPEEPLFRQVLDRYYDGDTDVATERLLGIGD
jgi:uncharacterized protein (DUF1810 family)